jgi:hypothetical protein
LRPRAVDGRDSLREELRELAVSRVDPRAEVLVLALDPVAALTHATRRLLWVDAAYRQLAEFFPQRITTIDGMRPQREIAEEIIGGLRQHS